MGERRCRCRCRCWMSGMGSRGDLASGALLSPPRSHARTHTHTHIYICMCVRTPMFETHRSSRRFPRKRAGQVDDSRQARHILYDLYITSRAVLLSLSSSNSHSRLGPGGPTSASSMRTCDDDDDDDDDVRVCGRTRLL